MLCSKAAVFVAGLLVIGLCQAELAMAESRSDVRDLARQHTQAAVETLVSVMEDESAPHSARVAAANALLDRGFGKAVQHKPELAMADRVEQNIKIMAEAARKLEFHEPSDNRAYLLVKQETFRAPVAVIFGYGGNAEGCEEIAEIVSKAPRGGTFKCTPIY